MADRIIYTLVSNGGGVDGLDPSDKGGVVVEASFDKARLLRSKRKPWAEVVPTVVDVAERRKQILASLNPVDRLILESGDDE